MGLGTSRIVTNIIIRAENLAGTQFSELQGQMAAASMEGATFGEKFGAVSSGLASFMTRIGLVGIAIAAFSVITAVHFDSAAAHIQAMTSASASQVDALKGKAIELSNTFGLSATEIVKSAYDVYSAVGLPFPQLKIMEAGTKAAAASGSDLNATMKALTTTLVDFPHGFKSADDAAGQMIKTVQLGRMQMDAYASSISTTEPLAAKLGISYSTLGAVLVELTRHGNSAAQANMMMRNSIIQIVQPNINARNASEALGLSWQVLYHTHGANYIQTLHAIYEASMRNVGSEKAVAEATGLHGVRLDKLYAQLKDHNALLKLLTGSTLSFSEATQILAGKGYADLIRSQKEIANGAITMAQAWDVVKKNAGTQLEILKENVINLGIAVGEILMPALVAVSHIFVPILQTMAIAASHHKLLTGLVVGLSGAFLALGVALHLVHFGFELYKTAYLSLIGAIKIISVWTGLTDATTAQTAALSKLSVETTLTEAVQKRLAAEELLVANAGKLSEAQMYKQIGAIMKSKDAEVALVAAKQKSMLASSEYNAALNNGAKIADLQRAKTDALALAETKLTAIKRASLTIGRELKGATEAEIATTNDLKKASEAQALTQAKVNDLTKLATAFEGQNVEINKELKIAKEANALATVNLRDAEIANNTAQAVSANLAKAYAASQLRVKDAKIASAAASKALKEAQAMEGISEADLIVLKEADVVATQELAVAQDEAAAAAIALDVALSPLEAILGATVAIIGITVGALLIWVAVIAAVAIGMYELYEHCKPFHDLVNIIAETITNKVVGAFRLLGDALDAIGGKFDILGGFWNAFVTGLEVAIPPLGILIELIKHWGDIMNWAGGIMGGLGSHIGGLFASVGKAVPIFGQFGESIKGIGGAFSAFGASIDNLGKKTESFAEKQTAAFGSSSKDMNRMTALSKDFWANQRAIIDNAEAAFEKTHQKFYNSVKSFTQAANNEYNNMNKTLDDSVTKAANSVVSKFKWMHDQVLAHFNDMINKMSKPIHLPPIQLAVASGDMTEKMKGSQVKDNLDPANKSMELFHKDMATLGAAMAKLPPDFVGAVDAISRDMAKKIDTAHKDFLAKLSAEDTRYVNAVNAARTVAINELKAANATALQAQKAENAAYNSKLNQIQTDHDNRVQAFATKMQDAFRTMLSNYQTTMMSLEGKHQTSDANHAQRLNDLNQRMQAWMANNANHHNAMQIQIMKDTYNKAVHIEDTRYNNELKVIGRQETVDAARMKSHNDALNRHDKAWAADENARLAKAKQMADATHMAHIHGIEQKLKDHVTKIHQTLTENEAKLLTTHQAHVKALEVIFHKHVTDIGKAMKAVAAPAGLWDAIKQKSDDLANNSLKALSLAILENTGKTKGLIATHVQAQLALQKLSVAAAKADGVLGPALLKAGAFGAGLEAIGRQTTTQYAAALAKVTADHYEGIAVSKKDKEALQAAINAQNKLSNAQAAAAQDATDMGKKTKKSADEWVSALNTYKTSIDTKLNAAMDQQILHYARGGKAVDDYQHKLDNNAQKLETLNQAEARVSNEWIQAQLRAAKAAGDWATVAELTKTKVGNALTKATDAYVAALGVAGTDTTKLGADLTKAAQDAYKKSQAEAAAAQIVTNAEIAQARKMNDLGTVFDKTKTQIDSNLNKALSAAAQEFIDLKGRVLPNTIAGLVALQKQANDAANAQAVAKAIADGTYNSLDYLSKAATEAAKTTANDYVNALYLASKGNQQAANSLGDLKAKAIDAANKEYDMAQAAKKFTDQLNLAVLAGRTDFDSTLAHAKAVYEDALATYENAVTMHLSTDAINGFKQAAIEAGVALKKLEDIPSEIEKAISDIVDPGSTDAETPYQQAELGIQDQKLALADQKQAFTESLDQQKLDLAQKKLSDQEAKTNTAKLTSTATTTNELLKQQNQLLQLQLNAALEQLALQNKMLYLSRHGLSRVMVGDSIGFMNSLGGAGAMSTVSAGKF